MRAATSWVRRTKRGRSRLVNRSSSPRTLGLRTVTVPHFKVRRLSLPWPFRYPGLPSTAWRRWDLSRPNNSATSSSRISWISCCTSCLTHPSNCSHAILDVLGASVACFFMAAVSFLSGHSAHPFLTRKDNRPPHTFTHPLMIPPLHYE